MKKLIAILLSLILLTTAVVMGVFSLSVSAYNTDGVFRYSIFENGTVEIFSYYGSGGNVVVPTTFRGFPVKSIGFAAFMGKTNITSISIPEGVTTIEENAFQYCSNLTSVTLPNTLTLIGKDAFAYCNNSISVYIQSLSQWLNCTFETPSSTPSTYDLYIGKEKLTQISIPEGATFVNDYQFEGCTSITTLKLPKTLTKIGVHAFRGCKNIRSVYVPDLTSWCEVSFETAGGIYSNPLSLAKELYVNGKLITNLVIPDDVTSIKTEIFAGTSAITSLTMPKTVKTIGDGAFANCKNLTSVTISSGIKTLPERLFANCSNLKKVTIPSSVTKIKLDAFKGCNSISSIYLEDLNKWCTMSFDGENSTPVRENSKLYVNNKQITTLTIPSGVTSVNKYAFSNCSTFSKLVIPKSVTSIGSGAFENCTKISTVTLSTGITSIGNNAFTGCNSIKSVNISDLKAWCKIAFNNEMANPLYFADSLVLDGEEVTKITIPSGIAKIGNYAFCNYEGLKKLTIPNTVTTIGTGSFRDCTALTSVSFGKGVKTIGAQAFSGCVNLPSITIPTSVTSVKSDAFSGCNKIASVKITDLKAWCNISFENGYANPLCYANSLLHNGEKITQLVIPKGVTTIGSCTFYNYEALEKVSIPSTVKTIGDSAFYSCTALTAMTGGSNVKTVERCAFAWCENLTKETILDTVVNIGQQAFGPTALTKVTIAKGVKTIENYAFYNCKKLTDISIPDSVTTIGEEAFEHCTGLTQVFIPSSVTKIGKGAFWGCTNLADLVLSKKTTTFGISAFGYIESVDLTVWYSGSKADREQLNLTYNGGLNYADWHYNTCDPKHSYTNSCDKSCNKCQWKRTTKHTYSNACDKSCNICKSTRTVPKHSYKKIVTKATQTSNGKIKNVCIECGYTASTTTTIYKASGVKLSKTSYTYDAEVKKPAVVVKDSKGKTISKSHYTVTYASGRKNAGTYKVTVKMRGNYSGTKTLTFKIKPVSISKCKVKLSATSYTYNGKAKKPSVTVRNHNNNKLNGTHYTVTYASGRKNVGTYKVTIKMKGNYTGTKTLTFKINPAGTTVKSLTAGKKSLKVTITKKTAQVTGYQIQYATSKSFKTYKTRSLTSYKKTSLTLSGLSAKTTYYVRVRTYKTVNGKKVYSAWSTVKSLKTK